MNIVKKIFRNVYFEWIWLVVLITLLSVNFVFLSGSFRVSLVAIYAIMIFIQVVIMITKFQIKKERKTPIVNEELYKDVLDMIKAFPELGKLANDNMIDDKNGNKRLSVYGFSMVEGKYDELIIPVNSQKKELEQKNSIENINNMVSDIMEPNTK